MTDEDIDVDTDIDSDTEIIEDVQSPASVASNPVAPVTAVAPPEPVKAKSWNWIGSPSRPEAKKGDGISDLFRTDFDEDMDDVNDLVTVDAARDVVDAGEDGTLDDLVDVFEEDIMGVGELGQKPSRKKLRQLRAERKARRLQSDSQQSSLGRIGE